MADEWTLEFSMFPQTLHNALIETLMERRTLDRIKQ